MKTSKNRHDGGAYCRYKTMVAAHAKPGKDRSKARRHDHKKSRKRPAKRRKNAVTYQEFLEQKIDVAPLVGLDVQADQLNPALKPHQRDSVLWALRGGRRALFAAFGLGKTVMQLEWARIVAEMTGGQVLIVAPLNVRREFYDDATHILHQQPPVYVKTQAEAESLGARVPVVITNYERVRDGDIDPRRFAGVTLDEAATLRSFGSKTYQVFLDKFKGVRYKLVNTATPSPNRYKELIHYAGFLEIMDTGQALTRWFKRDSTKANNLTLYPGREREFWIWCASWGLFLQKPSDLGYSDEGYSLPPLEVRYHRLQTDLTDAGCEPNGQMKLMRDAAFGLRDAAREKRESIGARVAEARRIIAESPADEHFVLWHDLEAERHALTAALPNEPLTLKQLREMNGQPVWVEEINHWALIDIETGGRWSGIPFAVGAENGASFCYNIKARNLHCYRCMPLPKPPEVSE